MYVPSNFMINTLEIVQHLLNHCPYYQTSSSANEGDMKVKLEMPSLLTKLKCITKYNSRIKAIPFFQVMIIQMTD